MTDLSLWHKVDALTIIQASLLFSDQDPNTLDDYEGYIPTDIPGSFAVIKHALVEGLRSEKIEGEIIPHRYRIAFEDVYEEVEGSIDERESRVKLASAKSYLLAIGLPLPSLSSPAKSEQPYLDPSHARYSKKLAAAVRVWEALEDEVQLRGRNPKAAIEIWLRQHAKDLDLLNKEGSPNNHGIDQIAAVVNWKTKGGAPKTPEPRPTNRVSNPGKN